MQLNDLFDALSSVPPTRLSSPSPPAPPNIRSTISTMASSPAPRNADDDLDDLFDYDIDEADLQALDISVPAPKSPPPAAKKDDLGLDEEIKVRKARRPTVKLDEKRYVLSCAVCVTGQADVREKTARRKRDTEASERRTRKTKVQGKRLRGLWIDPAAESLADWPIVP